MTEELKKQGIADDAAVAETVEETGATSDLDEAAKAAAAREARRQALYEANERAEDERARAEAERMRDVDDEDEDETPRDTWATVRRLWSEAAGDHWRFYIVFASIVFYAIFNTAAPAYSARVIDELWGHIQVAFANDTTFNITWENCGRTIFIYFMIWTAAASFYALQSFLMSSVAERLNLRLRNRIAQKLNRLPLAYFDAHRPGEVVSRATNDLDKMSESMQRGLLQLLVSIGTVVGAVSVMFVFSVPLTLVFLFFTALSLLVTKVVSRRTHDVTGERQEWVSKITSAVEEGYSGRLVIRAFNRERQSSAALIAAQQTADPTDSEAREKAERIKTEADPKAREVIRQALAEKQNEIEEIENHFSAVDTRQINTEMFIKSIRKYRDIRKLTPQSVSDSIDKIVVGKRQNIDGVWVRQFDIYYRFVGLI